MLLGIVAVACGEVAAFVRGVSPEKARRADTFELHKCDFATGPAHEPVRLDGGSGAGAELSVVLVTDAFATIEKVVTALSDQRAPERLELVIVTPSPEEVRADISAITVFGGVRVVPVESLAGARGASGGGHPRGKRADRLRRRDPRVPPARLGGGADRGTLRRLDRSSCPGSRTRTPPAR